MRIFLVCLTAWFIAQVIKVIINFTKYIVDKKKGRKAKKVTLETLFKLGGMHYVDIAGKVGKRCYHRVAAPVGNGCGDKVIRLGSNRYFAEHLRRSQMRL